MHLVDRISNEFGEFADVFFSKIRAVQTSPKIK